MDDIECTRAAQPDQAQRVTRPGHGRLAYADMPPPFVDRFKGVGRNDPCRVAAARTSRSVAVTAGRSGRSLRACYEDSSPDPFCLATLTMLGVLDWARRDLIVRTSRTKRSSDFIALLEEVDRRYGPKLGVAIQPLV